MSKPSHQVARAAVVDVAIVVLFVVIGRRNHDESTAASGIAGTAAPFLVALALGWVVALAWRQPFTARTGAVIWITTLVVGMPLRRFVFDDGTATAFVIVATVFLGAGLNLWRVAARRLTQATAD
jgi:Protein of unknown function (DUF3054)